MTIAILGAGIAGLFAAVGIVMVNRAAMRRRIEHVVRW
jgi:thioredoxin reductase